MVGYENQKTNVVICGPRKNSLSFTEKDNMEYMAKRLASEKLSDESEETIYIKTGKGNEFSKVYLGISRSTAKKIGSFDIDTIIGEDKNWISVHRSLCYTNPDIYSAYIRCGQEEEDKEGKEYKCSLTGKKCNIERKKIEEKATGDKTAPTCATALYFLPFKISCQGKAWKFVTEHFDRPPYGEREGEITGVTHLFRPVKKGGN